MNITFLYKCRRCGAIERTTTTWANNELGAIRRLADALDGSQRPPMLGMHACAGESFGFGVTDLIGYEPEQPSTSAPLS